MKVLGDVLYISVDGEIRGHDLKLNRPKDFSILSGMALTLEDVIWQSCRFKLPSVM